MPAGREREGPALLAGRQAAQGWRRPCWRRRDRPACLLTHLRPEEQRPSRPRPAEAGSQPRFAFPADRGASTRGRGRRSAPEDPGEWGPVWSHPTVWTPEEPSRGSRGGCCLFPGSAANSQRLLCCSDVWKPRLPGAAPGPWLPLRTPLCPALPVPYGGHWGTEIVLSLSGGPGERPADSPELTGS